MSHSEFDLIQRFKKQRVSSSYTQVGIGDDAAVFTLGVGQDLVTSIDTLNKGVHFPNSTEAHSIGHKALAVSLSDMAAMGADPVNALLSLALPRVDESWLDEFAKGFFQLAEQYKVELIGGDLTKGPLSVSTVVNGLVPRGCALLRKGARVGDLICVTGVLGGAGLALKLLQQEQVLISEALLNELNYPQPRVQAGRLLRGLATAALDVSDGVLSDLSKLCSESSVGAELFASKVPLSPFLEGSVSQTEAIQLALTAGDEYELLFTLPKEKKMDLERLNLGVKVSIIGEIQKTLGVSLLDDSGKLVSFGTLGYDHFRGN